MKIKLSEFSTVIANSEIGEEIYLSLKKLLNKKDNIELDFDNVSVMTTFTAKQIFGRLYIELGSEDFYKKFAFKNTSNDLKIIIQNSIQDSVENQD